MWLSGVFGCHVPVGTPCNAWTVSCWDDRWSKGSSLGPGLGYVQHVLPQPSHVLCVNPIPWEGFDSELVTPSHPHEVCFWTFVDTGLACSRSFWRALAVLYRFARLLRLLHCWCYAGGHWKLSGDHIYECAMLEELWLCKTSSYPAATTSLLWRKKKSI